MPDRSCSLPDCDRKLIARELCSLHYQRLVKTGTTDARPARTPKPPCSIDDCDKPSASRGWCEMHYGRYLRNGNTDLLPTRKRRTTCTVSGCDAGGRMTRGLCARHYWRLRHHGETGPVEVLLRLDVTVCEVDGCERTDRIRRGWCSMHYQRWQHHGDPLHERPATPSGCAVHGCEREHASRGLCGTHYARMLRTGTTADPVPAEPEPCSIEGCDKLTASRSWCTTHYARWTKYGDPMIVQRVVVKSETGLCEIDGCGLPHSGKGMCKPHYHQRRHVELRETHNARMRAHYQANREYYYAKTDDRRRAVAEMDLADRAITAAYRRAISSDVCHYCGAPGEHADHFFPLAKGGTNYWFNLVRACAPCNKSKAAHCGTWWSLRREIGESARSVPPLSEAG